MLLVKSAVLAVAVAAVVVPTATANAAPRPAAARCATYSDYKSVTDGQTVAQVRHELHSKGDPNGRVVTDNGFRLYAPNFRTCSGLFKIGVDFRANPGKTLKVNAKTII